MDFEDDDKEIDSGKSANKRALDKFNKRKAAAPEPSHDDDSDDDEGSEFEIDAPVKDEEPDLDRQGKKRQRYTEMRSERDNSQRESQELRERLSQLEQRAMSYPDPRNIQMREQSQESRPEEKELSDTYAAQESVIAQYNGLKAAGALTAEQADKLEGRARELKRQEARLLVRLESEPRQGIDPSQVEQIANRSRMQAEYPEVASNRQAVMWASAHYQQLRAEGHGESYATAQLALNTARAKFFGKQSGSAGSRREASDKSRHLYQGAPRGGGGGGVGRSDGGARSISVTPAMEKQALALYRHDKTLTEKQKIQKWVNGPGKRLVASKGKERE